MTIKEFTKVLESKATEKGLESAELTALGRGFDNKGVYYVVMVKPDNADRDIEIRIYVNQK